MSDVPHNEWQVPCSETQEKMLRILCSLCKSSYHTQVAGHGRVKWLSAARALVRRGLAATYRTGWYAPTDVGRAWVVAHPKEVKHD